MEEQERQSAEDVHEFRAVQAENGRWFLWQRIGDEEDGFEWRTVGECDALPLNGAAYVTLERLTKAMRDAADEADRRYIASRHRENLDIRSENYIGLVFDELRKEP